jgi:hypothetical protein
LKRLDLKFKVGDRVLLSTRKLKLAVAGAAKFKVKFGTYEVVKRMGSVAYRLTLPESMARVHPVFHASLLKPYVAVGKIWFPHQKWLMAKLDTSLRRWLITLTPRIGSVSFLFNTKVPAPKKMPVCLIVS